MSSTPPLHNLSFYIRLFVLFCFWVVITATGQAQPINGCYIGAYLGCGSVDSSCNTPSDFNTLTGKNHYCFSRYIDAGNDSDLLDNDHWTWADTLATIGAKPVFFLMPFGGLTNYINGNRDTALSNFAVSCAAFNQAVYIVFGHEMNGGWYPWGKDSINYTLAFRHVHDLMSAIAPNIQFCWIPIQAWGQDNYSPYFPGNNYVDWVGMNLYDRDWDENNTLGAGHIQAAIDFQNFYQYFSQDPGKPMMIAESAFFDANQDPTAPGTRIPLSDSLQYNSKNLWISQLYDTAILKAHFPNLNMIIYFQVRKMEDDFSTQNHNFGTLDVDWRIPLQVPFNIYSGIIADSYFIGAIPVDIQEYSQEINKEMWLRVYPNPASDIIKIEYFLPGNVNYQIYLINSNGQRIGLIHEGYTQGKTSFTYSVNDLEQGVYFISFKSKENKVIEKVVIKH